MALVKLSEENRLLVWFDQNSNIMDFMLADRAGGKTIARAMA